MRFVKTLLCLLASLLLAAEAYAQGNPTGTVSGRVTGQDGAALPGVTVTAASPNLQGVRSVTTTAVGDYIIPFLPPGQYTLAFELQGFKSAEQATLVTAAGTVTLDAKLQVAGVAEAVTVTPGMTAPSCPITRPETVPVGLPCALACDASSRLASRQSSVLIRFMLSSSFS